MQVSPAHWVPHRQLCQGKRAEVSLAVLTAVPCHPAILLTAQTSPSHAASRLAKGNLTSQQENFQDLAYGESTDRSVSTHWGTDPLQS